MKKVIIIGGGPAGIMSAISAAKRGNEVTILEQNSELGKKLLITGNGRCNITNSAEPEKLLLHVYRNPKFLTTAFRNFTSRDLLALLHSHGLKTKEEAGGRVFPVSDDAKEVRDLFLTILKAEGVTIEKNFRVEDLIIEDGCCKGIRGAEPKQDSYIDMYADVVILATGGLAVPSTGSKGWGLKKVADLGHEIIEPIPGLSPIKLNGSWWKELQGLTLKDVRLYRSKKEEVIGDLLFTHFGISGPTAIRMSSLMGKNRSSQGAAPETNQTTILLIDAIPTVSREELDSIIKTETQTQGNRQVRTILNELAPKDFIKALFDLYNIPRERKLGDLSKKERSQIIEGLKALPLEVKGVAGFEQAIITSGGISTKEINPKNMESKLIKNLRFAGEIIDVDAETGGYNLQIAWSAGWAAGNI